MRRNALALSLLLATSACGAPAVDAVSEPSVVPPERTTSASPVLTAEPRFVEVEMPEVWPAELSEDDYTPYGYFYFGHRLQPGLPDFAQWCADRGLIEDPVLFLKRERWFDSACMESYLGSRGVGASTIDLFVRTSITISDLTVAGPIALAKGSVWEEYYVNDSWGSFIFTPDGMLDLRDAFPDEARWAFWADIEAIDTFAQIRALHDADPPLEAEMWWDVAMGAPAETPAGYVIPVEWLMHEFCHACTTPYGVRAELRFDRSGGFGSFAFDRFCVTAVEGFEDWGPDPLGLPSCELFL